ncbi:glycosyltransferase family 4 protein [Actinopolymorpha rutila]|uniref:Glycosyltransferase involved in cell wall biosynthesis n=1 Tax=Actinopolymorpha rutila TaxID=446787 RepID=A0A852ZH40_9ACTN|nr:glycosyltransferase family 4 protein [Actinopolymorpha rutila]NYH88360.1 glycosyltransferase involved in cell wall biosynthesis [Actinopolymorpha rutila]
MHVLITAVGERTEHWVDLFRMLAKRPDVRLTVLAANVSRLTVEEMDRLDRGHPRISFHLANSALSKGSTGRMASVVFGRGTGRALADVHPDVVHIIGEAGYLSTSQVLRMRRHRWPDVPVTLYAAQNVVTRFPFSFPQLERRAYRAVDCALPTTPAAEQVLRAKGYRGASRIVPLGVDTSLFHPGPSSPPTPGAPFTVGFVGRLEPHKGITDLLTAVRHLNCDLLLVGTGPLSGEVVRESQRRRDRIELHPWVSHHALPALLTRMDVLALPSLEVFQRNVAPWITIPLREQFSRVLVEAMACGVPVVGSDAGEIPHAIGTAGLIHPAGDVDALVTRLRQVRDDQDLAERLRVAGMERARRFDWSRVADSLYELWQALVDTGRRPVDTADRGAPAPGTAGRPTVVDPEEEGLPK